MSEEGSMSKGAKHSNLRRADFSDPHEQLHLNNNDEDVFERYSATPLGPPVIGDAWPEILGFELFYQSTKGPARRERRIRISVRATKRILALVAIIGFLVYGLATGQRGFARRALTEATRFLK